MLKHCYPGMCEGKVLGILVRYAGREERLLEELISKYGPEPPTAVVKVPEEKPLPQLQNTQTLNVSQCSHRITFEPPQLQVPKGYQEWKSWKNLIPKDADGKLLQSDYCFNHSMWEYQIRPQLWLLLYRCESIPMHVYQHPAFRTLLVRMIREVGWGTQKFLELAIKAELLENGYSDYPWLIPTMFLKGDLEKHIPEPAKVSFIKGTYGAILAMDCFSPLGLALRGKRAAIDLEKSRNPWPQLEQRERLELLLKEKPGPVRKVLPPQPFPQLEDDDPPDDFTEMIPEKLEENVTKAQILPPWVVPGYEAKTCTRCNKMGHLESHFFNCEKCPDTYGKVSNNQRKKQRNDKRVAAESCARAKRKHHGRKTADGEE